MRNILLGLFICVMPGLAWGGVQDPYHRSSAPSPTSPLAQSKGGTGATSLGAASVTPTGSSTSYTLGNALISGVMLGTSTAATNPHKLNDATTGLYSATATNVSVAIGGVQKMVVDSTGIGLSTLAPTRGTAGTLADIASLEAINVAPGGIITADTGKHVVTKNYCAAVGAAGCFFMNGTTTEVDRVTDSVLSLTTTGTVTSGVSSAYRDWTGTQRTFSYPGKLYASVEDGLLDITGTAFSIVAITTNKKPINSGDPAYIATKWNTTGDQRQYALETIDVSANNTYKYQLLLSSTGGNTSYYATTGEYAINTTHCIAYVYNGIDVRAYVDGVHDSTVARTTAIFNGTALFVIGNRDGGTTFGQYTGDIDDVLVTNTALSAGDVANICRDGINGNRGGVEVATAFTLPAAAAGKYHCFKNSTGTTNAITIAPPTGGYVEAQDGSVYCTISHAIASSGALGDSICYTAVDSTYWNAMSGANGAWTCQ